LKKVLHPQSHRDTEKIKPNINPISEPELNGFHAPAFRRTINLRLVLSESL
jgi:hypothetical protein